MMLFVCVYVAVPVVCMCIRGSPGCLYVYTWQSRLFVCVYVAVPVVCVCIRGSPGCLYVCIRGAVPVRESLMGYIVVVLRCKL